MKVVLKDLTKRFPNRKKGEPDVIAVNNFNIEIPDGKLIGLLGPSGCGKSTCLNLICGLETPTEGRIFFGDDDVTDLPPERRGVGMVFQSYALYPHLTVQQNIMFPLQNIKGDARPSKEEMIERANEVAKLVQIDGLMSRLPSELSGGQQQRVAIARTLAPGPKVLFMDEPLSNLDAKLRLEMRSELQRLHLTTGSTFVYVTHDQMEAMTLATRICLIDNGVLQQYDQPLDVYNKPNNTFVADFVGNPAVNFIQAKGVQQANGTVALTMMDGISAVFTPAEKTDISAWAKEAWEATEAQRNKVRNVEKSNKDTTFKVHINYVDDSKAEVIEEPGDEDFMIGIRPEFINISENGAVEGEVFSAMPTGMETTVRIRVGNYLLTGVVFGGITYSIGQKVRFDFRGDSIMLFGCKTGMRCTNGRVSFG